MSWWISLLNNAAVTIYGIVLSASFCDVLKTPRKRKFLLLAMLLLIAEQGVVYALFDAALSKKLYPLTVHLPLALTLLLLTKQVRWSFISVMVAYLCCQLRRWVALLFVMILSGGDLMQNTIELLVTAPLLLALLRYLAPAVRQLSSSGVKTQLRFGVTPALYYGFDYLTCVYTDLLKSGNSAVLEFMPFVCCLLYVEFLLYYLDSVFAQNQLHQTQKSLNLQLTQAVREIQALRASQELAAQYRHDMRHHLQYISTCIESGQQEQAQAYIADIFREIEAQKVERYCENEAANLILSSFAARAAKAGVSLCVQSSLPPTLAISDSDLCVIVSNALENAIHACQPLVASGRACVIDVRLYEKGGKLFLQVTNPCDGDVRFVDGLPVTDQPGHGLGVQSICAIVQRCGGVYSFLMQDGKFILRLSL